MPRTLEMTIPGTEDAHVTLGVTSRVESSANVPVAVNCMVLPLAMCAFRGAIARRVMATEVTVSAADPFTFDKSNIEKYAAQF